MEADPRILVIAATGLELRITEALAVRSLVCGIGPVEAAAHTAAALARDTAAAVLHVGVAGARSDSGLAIGDVVLGEEAVYEDIAGDVAARMPRIERLRPDSWLLGVARDALPAAAVLPVGTTARVGAGRACAVEAMEGFAVLRACELAGVPALEVRSISNHVDDDRDRWRLDDALVALGEAVAVLVDAVGAALAQPAG